MSRRKRSFSFYSTEKFLLNIGIQTTWSPAHATFNRRLAILSTLVQSWKFRSQWTVCSLSFKPNCIYFTCADLMSDFLEKASFTKMMSLQIANWWLLTSWMSQPSLGAPYFSRSKFFLRLSGFSPIFHNHFPRKGPVHLVQGSEAQASFPLWLANTSPFHQMILPFWFLFLAK